LPPFAIPPETIGPAQTFGWQIANKLPISILLETQWVVRSRYGLPKIEIIAAIFEIRRKRSIARYPQT
jgi:hypothetical protein